MSNFNFNIEQEIALLDKYNLNPTELFFLRLLLLTQEDEQEDNLFKFISLKSTISIREILEGLQDKGMILKSYKFPKPGEDLNVYSIPLNKNMTKTFHKAAFDMGEELFAHYPQWCFINGRAVAIRSISKKFNTQEDAYRYYGKLIKWNPDTHKRIIELLDWANGKDIINFSLSSFIVDRRWLDLEAMQDGKISNMCFDSFTDI